MAETTRLVHPLGLVEKGATWYLVAGTEKGLRTFRVNRIRAVEVTDDPAERPPGFDLAETWRAVVDEVEGKRAVVQARLRTSRYVAQALRAQFGPSTRVVEASAAADPPAGSDDVEVLVGAPTSWRIARHLAGWGDVVEVIEPAEVRAHLAAIGATLVARYGAPTPAEA